MKITEKILNQYKRDGYIHLPNLMGESATDELLRGFIKILRRIIPEVLPKDFDSLSWRSLELNRVLIELRSENRDKFSIFYDSMQTSFALQRLFSSGIIAETVSVLLREPIETLSVTDFVLRMDAPDDSRNRLDWHQDSSYFLNNINGNNGSVCFIALSGASEEEGALEISPKSHRQKRIKVTEEKGETFTSFQYAVPEKYVKNYPVTKLICKPGDTSFFNMDIIHRSGMNTSNRFRFNAIARFHRMSTQDHIPGHMVYIPNKKVLNTLLSAKDTM
jgi:hypothetical protein